MKLTANFQNSKPQFDFNKERPMKALNNLNLFTKIISGYLVVLALLAIVGGVALFRLNQINTTVTHLVDNLAEDRQLAEDMVTQIVSARLYANKYLRTKSQDDQASYQKEMTKFDELLATADKKITDAARVEMLALIKADLQEYRTGFTEITQLIADRDKIEADELNVQGPLVADKLNEVLQSAYEENDTIAIFYGAQTQAAVLLMRLDVFKYLELGDEQWVTKFEERYQQARTVLDQFDAKVQDDNHRQLMAEAKAAVEAYNTAFHSLRDDYATQNELVTKLVLQP